MSNLSLSKLESACVMRKLRDLINTPGAALVDSEGSLSVYHMFDPDVVIVSRSITEQTHQTDDYVARMIGHIDDIEKAKHYCGL